MCCAESVSVATCAREDGSKVLTPSFDSGSKVSISVFWDLNNVRVVLEMFSEVAGLRCTPYGLFINDWRDPEHIFSAMFAIFSLLLETFTE